MAGMERKTRRLLLGVTFTFLLVMCLVAMARWHFCEDHACQQATGTHLTWCVLISFQIFIFSVLALQVRCTPDRWDLPGHPARGPRPLVRIVKCAVPTAVCSTYAHAQCIPDWVILLQMHFVTSGRQ